MSREILFRGWCPRNEKWIEGDVIFKGSDVLIRRRSDGMYFPVKSPTVCQYTGLTDKNGKKIFEGDIVKLEHLKCNGLIRFGSYSNTSRNGDTNYGWHVEFLPDKGYYRKDFGYWIDRMIVIENYFDNPKLLEYADENAAQYADNPVLAPAT